MKRQFSRSPVRPTSAARFDGLEARRLMSAVSWDGGAGTVNWNDARNWSTDVLPGAADDVTISKAGVSLVTLSGNAASVRSLNSNATIQVNGTTLSLAAASTVRNLTLNNGGLDGAGDLDDTGTLNWAGGMMSGSGRTTVRDTATLGSTAANYDEFIAGSRTLRFEGSASVTASNSNFGIYSQSGAARVEVAQGRPLTLNNAASIYGVPATLVIEQNAQLGHTGTGTSNVTWTTNSSGAFYAAAGTMSFTGTTNVSPVGYVQPELNTTITFGGTTTINGALGGSGVIGFNGGTAEINGYVGQVRTLAFTDGTVNVNAAATIGNFLGGIEVTYGTVNFNSGETPAFTTLLQTGGTLGGGDAISFTGAAVWHGGAMNGTGTTTFDGGATLGSAAVAYDERLNGSRTLRFDSDATLLSPSTSYGLLVDSSAVHVDVTAGHTLTVDGNAQLYGAPATFTLPAGATLVHSGAATSQMTINWNVQAVGAIRNDAGLMQITTGGVFSGSTTVAAGATIRFAYGTASLQGNGGIGGAGSLEFNGATVTVRDVFALSAATNLFAGTLTVDANTTTSSLTFTNGLLDGGGTLTVAGPLVWRTGTMSGTGKTIVNGTATLGSKTANYDERLGRSRTLRIAGYATLDSINGNWGLLADNAAVRVEVASDAELVLGGNANIYGNVAMLEVEPRGTVTHTNGGADAATNGLIGWKVDNHGSVNVSAGTLTLQAALDQTGSQAANGNGTYRVRSGAALTFSQPITTLVYGLEVDGNGVVNGVGGLVGNRGRIALTGGADLAIQPAASAIFNNEGAIELSADSVLSITGNARFGGPDASLRVELAGDTEFGKFAVSGSLDLGSEAELSAWLADGYDPTVGTRHDVIVAGGSVIGAFATFEADDTQSGQQLITTRPAANVVAVDVAVPVPAPHVTGQTFDYQTRQAIVLHFDRNVGASLGREDVIVRNVTTGQTLSNAIGTVVYDAATDTAILDVTGLLADGRYEVTLDVANIRDGQGTVLVDPGQRLTFNVLAGDANRDGIVGFDDLLVLAQNYGGSGKTFSQGNLNYSAGGQVNFDDLLLLAQQYGKTLPTLASFQATPAKAAKRNTNGALAF